MLGGTEVLVFLLFCVPLLLLTYILLIVFQWAARLLHIYELLFAQETDPSVITQDSERSPQSGYAAESCPICMASFTYKVQTNCGHSFCEPCFFLHWRSSVLTRKVNCPLCRSPVSRLTERFTENETSHCQMPRSFVQAFNRSFAQSGWRLQRPVDLLNSLWDTVLVILRGGMTPVWNTLRHLVLPALVGLYLLSPVDLLPEAVLGPLGLVDDLLVIGFYALQLFRLLRR
ncbi:hypothetical protein D915_005861 [Fasciola hepatica]|uniref:E3 ubiquitin-protein ligase RNF170 n=1 Tax=Fasciola hepatica TaxID=6192 RepID=A0A2H1C8B0_FASHE|nr:hypothetical protein D915_005861 [Fasciola hepatica]